MAAQLRPGRRRRRFHAHPAARNLADHPFTNRANLHQKTEIEAKLRDCVTRLETPGKLTYVEISQLSRSTGNSWSNGS